MAQTQFFHSGAAQAARCLYQQLEPAGLRRSATTFIPTNACEKTGQKIMNISTAAKASGVSAKMIRYYEQIALIPRTHRNSSGYRTYSDSDVHRLRFIRRARELGFSIAEIQELLSLWSDKKRKSADVKRIAQTHIDELEHRIASLRQMADTLQTLVSCCAGNEYPDCPILDGLEAIDDRKKGREQNAKKPSSRKATPSRQSFVK